MSTPPPPATSDEATVIEELYTAELESLTRQPPIGDPVQERLVKKLAGQVARAVYALQKAQQEGDRPQQDLMQSRADYLRYKIQKVYRDAEIHRNSVETLRARRGSQSASDIGPHRSRRSYKSARINPYKTLGLGRPPHQESRSEAHAERSLRGASEYGGRRPRTPSSDLWVQAPWLFAGQGWEKAVIPTSRRLGPDPDPHVPEPSRERGVLPPSLGLSPPRGGLPVPPGAPSRQRGLFLPPPFVPQEAIPVAGPSRERDAIIPPGPTLHNTHINFVVTPPSQVNGNDKANEMDCDDVPPPHDEQKYPGLVKHWKSYGPRQREFVRYLLGKPPRNIKELRKEIMNARKLEDEAAVAQARRLAGLDRRPDGKPDLTADDLAIIASYPESEPPFPGQVYVPIEDRRVFIKDPRPPIIEEFQSTSEEESDDDDDDDDNGGGDEAMKNACEDVPQKRDIKGKGRAISPNENDHLAAGKGGGDASPKKKRRGKKKKVGPDTEPPPVGGLDRLFPAIPPPFLPRKFPKGGKFSRLRRQRRRRYERYADPDRPASLPDIYEKWRLESEAVVEDWSKPMYPIAEDLLALEGKGWIGDLPFNHYLYSASEHGRQWLLKSNIPAGAMYVA